MANFEGKKGKNEIFRKVNVEWNRNPRNRYRVQFISRPIFRNSERCRRGSGWQPEARRRRRRRDVCPHLGFDHNRKTFSACIYVYVRAWERERESNVSLIFFHTTTFPRFESWNFDDGNRCQVVGRRRNERPSAGCRWNKKVVSSWQRIGNTNCGKKRRGLRNLYYRD